MTDSNGDLVEKVARAIAETQSDLALSASDAPARAAIAAVLDDLAEPTGTTKAICADVGKHLNARYNLSPLAPDGGDAIWEIVRAMLDAKRKELGL